MLHLHPIIRLLSALLIVVAIFLARSMAGLILVYSFVILLLLVSRVSLNHFRFVAYVTMPILLALVVLWGWVIDSQQVPFSYKTGVNYALFLWLRIVSWGGMLQFLFLPLIEHPSHLKSFLDRTGLRGVFGILIITSIIFLPEMRRRLGQIIDARHAQGNSLRGLKGLKDLPSLLMPLVSSILDSAAKRAELWSHRGILESGRGASREIAYNIPLSAFFLMYAFASCVMVLLL